MKRNFRVALLLALLLPALVGAASARDAGMHHRPTMGDNGPGQGMMMSGMCPMMMLSKHPEGALAFLKTELDITASEADAWDAFAEAYRDAKSDKMAGPSAGMMGGGDTMQSLPVRLAHHVKMMQDHLNSLKSLQAPLAELYATFSSDQKRTADELVPMFVMCQMM